MSVTVFCFHAVVVEPLEVPHFCFVDRRTFARQLFAIRSRYNILPMSAGLERLWSGEAGSGRKPDAVITFDDGYQNNHDLVLPLLVELGVPAACFINSSAVDTGRPLWFCRVHHAFSRTSHTDVEWAGRRLALGSVPERAAAVRVVDADLKDLPGDAVDDEVDHLCRRLEVDPDGAGGIDAYRPLDRVSIEAMVESGLFEFGGHGDRHVILSTVEPLTQLAEVVTSVEAVRRMTGQPAEVFAYPNGRTEDYDEHTVAALERAGVTAAFTAVPGTCERDSSRWDLPRMLLGPGD
jgi:peptidoglycan/xylan/chitin deacetylase (PgdA/CDA1 family)